MSEVAVEDVRYVLGLNLTDKDVRYKRVLAALLPAQVCHAAGVYVQVMAYGVEADGAHGRIEEMGGRAANCMRMAVLAGFSYMPQLHTVTRPEYEIKHTIVGMDGETVKVPK